MNAPLSAPTFARLVEMPAYMHRILLRRCRGEGTLPGSRAVAWGPAREAIRAYYESHNDAGVLSRHVSAMARAIREGSEPAQRLRLEENLRAIEQFRESSASLRLLRPTDNLLLPVQGTLAGLDIEAWVDLEAREGDEIRRLLFHFGAEPLKASHARAAIEITAAVLELGGQRVPISTIELVDLADDRVHHQPELRPRTLRRVLEAARSIGFIQTVGQLAAG